MELHFKGGASMDAVISDIQKFSLHDGPGIRTTVFFKGCNMRCAWCHNPETLFIKPEILFYSTKCIGCGCCYSVCKTGALTGSIEGNGYRIYNKEFCTNCGECVDVCAPAALKTVGKRMSIEEVMEIIREDKDYYIASEGGVTLSGGEVMVQADFAAQLLKKCKEEGISTAIESNMFGSFDTISKLLCDVDRIYCDIKLIDNQKHIQYTGVSNESILNNIKKLSEYKIPLVIRTPLIPGITDDVENIVGIARWIKKNAVVEYYELLKYNPLAEAKTEELGKQFLLGKLERTSKQQLTMLKNAVSAEGIPMIIGGE